jgi:hypothetical protein
MEVGREPLVDRDTGTLMGQDPVKAPELMSIAPPESQRNQVKVPENFGSANVKSFDLDNQDDVERMVGEARRYIEPDPRVDDLQDAVGDIGNTLKSITESIQELQSPTVEANVEPVQVDEPELRQPEPVIEEPEDPVNLRYGKAELVGYRNVTKQRQVTKLQPVVSSEPYTTREPVYKRRVYKERVVNVPKKVARTVMRQEVRTRKVPKVVYIDEKYTVNIPETVYSTEMKQRTETVFSHFEECEGPTLSSSTNLYANDYTLPSNYYRAPASEFSEYREVVTVPTELWSTSFTGPATVSGNYVSEFTTKSNAVIRPARIRPIATGLNAMATARNVNATIRSNPQQYPQAFSFSSDCPNGVCPTEPSQGANYRAGKGLLGFGILGGNGLFGRR